MGNRQEEIYDWKFETLGDMGDAVERELGDPDCKVVRTSESMSWCRDRSRFSLAASYDHRGISVLDIVPFYHDSYLNGRQRDIQT